MQHNISKEAEAGPVPRRQFLRNATAATVIGLTPNRCLGGQPGSSRAATGKVDAMEQALEMLNGLAPLTNHGPMAAEALMALGRAEQIKAFVESYKRRFTASFPAAQQTVTHENWRAALGAGQRVADWIAFFQQELKDAAWPQVVERWTARLAPGMSAAAAHGIIRTGHAVRSLAANETDLRRAELAQGLGYWAAYYQPLPEIAGAKTKDTPAGQYNPAQAVSHIPLLPVEQRSPSGSIMVGLRSLTNYTPFGATADLLLIAGDADKLLSEVTEAFATVYVRNVTSRSVITLIHAVTGTTALRSLLPVLSPATRQQALRYGWQMAAALYAISGSGATATPAIAKEPPRATLIDRAVATQEEHAIKFTEACLREYALNPKPVYLQAAQDALTRIGGG